MNIRLACADDSPALLKIYKQYIHTPITFECTLPTAAAFAERIQTISRQYPYLVCQEGKNILGYAYAHRHMEREAYQWNAELSIYLDKRYTGQGLGKKLYGILMDILKIQGIQNVYAGVTLPNAPSQGLHRSQGFHLIGVYPHTGYKCGAWHDVAWFCKDLLPCEGVPASFVPIREIDPEKMERIISKYQ